MRPARHRIFCLIAIAAISVLGVSAAPASAAPEEFDKFAIESVSASLSDTQAGAHADMTIAIKLTTEGNQPYALLRDTTIELPPGVIGNPQAVPFCSPEQFGSETCPFASQVGTSLVHVIQPIPSFLNEPVYNLPPPKGTDIVARLAFVAAVGPAIINLRVNPSDFGLIASVEGVPSASGLSQATTTIWGIPSDPSHDLARITPHEAFLGGGPPEGRAVPPGNPFLSNPTDCSLAREVRVTAVSYQQPDRRVSNSTPFPEITGCSRLSFAPSFSATATNPEAAAPTGVDTTLTIPQSESPTGLATSTMKSARVMLPDGFAINPAAADGLQACTPNQVGYGDNAPAACPDASKIGSIEADVPALEEPLHGAVYQRAPEPGHLFGFWIVADEQGVHLKLPAQIEPNPLTGRLTVVVDHYGTLEGLPQVPVEGLKLNVFGGPRAPLATPDGCGTYLTEFSFAPWSGGPAAQGRTPLEITAGCGKGGFDPRIQAGSLSSAGGHYSPFVFTLTRQDGEANPVSITVHLPKGLLAKLAGVPLCPEAGAASGVCPSGSRLGSLTAASGVGGAPLWIPQPGKAPTAAYLGGPYKGAPYSIVSVVPAQAGPFDLGTVVNRAGIYIDPETALATIKTDPLPQILEGVPVSYRTVHVDIDRKNFTLNPTSCAPKTIAATVTAASGATAEPTDGFQASGCENLGFSPKLKLRLKGATKRTGNPAVRAVLTQPAGQAGIAAVTTVLPGSEFIDNSHINNPCTRVQFNAGACPRSSILGTARAYTPLLDKPLEGPIYFRSNGGDRELPDLVADLHGAVHITLVGFIDSVSQKGSESSRVRTRFLNVPDAPVSKFVLSLYGGKRGLLENSRNLCGAKLIAGVQMKAQNGKHRRTANPIGNSCKGGKAASGR